MIKLLKMIDLFSKIVSFVKKEPFLIDKNIPTSYLIIFFSTALIDFLRGCLRFGSPAHRIFIGKNTIVKCKNKIKSGINIKLSRNSYIDALSINGIVLGSNFSLGRYSSIECTGSFRTLGIGLVVGDNVGIGSYSFLGCAGGIVIGSDTIIGNYVSFHSENHNFSKAGTPIRLQGVSHQGIVIGKNCWIGAKVTILDGVRIQENTVIAAGAVVKAGVYESNALYAGVPAKKIRSLI